MKEITFGNCHSKEKASDMDIIASKIMKLP